jgi:dihydropteroate synthase
MVKPEETKRVIQLSGGRQLSLARPLVMGVLNVTPDSFSDGGLYDSPERAIAHAHQMVQEGADIIDIGGESSRPGSNKVSGEEERQRVVPIIERLAAESEVPISIDTCRAATARAAIEAGAAMVNDISAFRFDPELATVVAASGVPVILMHMQGTPRVMQMNPHYDDCVEEIALFFGERIRFCVDHGINRDRIVLDPGIGFGKRLSDNLAILSDLTSLRRFGLPVMVGASRKSFIAMLSPASESPDQRLGGSIAAAVAAVQNGADIVRVHDVAQTVEALKVIQGIRAAG